MSAAACLMMTWNWSKQMIINIGLLETIKKKKYLPQSHQVNLLPFFFDAEAKNSKLIFTCMYNTTDLSFLNI